MNGFNVFSFDYIEGVTESNRINILNYLCFELSVRCKIRNTCALKGTFKSKSDGWIIFKINTKRVRIVVLFFFLFYSFLVKINS